MTALEQCASQRQNNSISQSIAFALPKLALFLLIGGPLAVMPGVYSKYFGLSLSAIALATFSSRLFDGLTDPFVGYLSDFLQKKYGTRKPLIILGGVMVLLSSSLFYIPYGWDINNPEPVDFFYFLFFYLAFTLSWTVMDVPHTAWGADVSSDTKGRSRRFGFRTIAAFTAPVIFFGIPFLPFFETTEVTPETFRFAVYLCWVLMPICLLVCMYWVPDPERYIDLESSGKKIFDKREGASKKFNRAAKMVVRNRPLCFFYMAYALVGLAYAVSTGLTFFFVSNYLGISEKLPLAFMVHFIVGVPSAYGWSVVAQKIGARSTWALGTGICMFGLVGAGFLSPGDASFLPYVVCKALIGGGHAATFVAGYMVLANIADYGKWKFDQECSGAYFSLNSTVIKLSGSIGITLGLMLAQWLGFDPQSEIMSEQQIVALRFSYIGLPVLLFIIGIIAIIKIPISFHHGAIIAKRLNLRALRAGL